jgi:2-aminoethylphosphonate-pyruvate transaminase
MTDKKLFTPGPLSTSRTVKEAMLRDVGSRDAEFIETVRDIRRRLLGLARVDPGAYAAVLMQGSGTFAIESVVGSALPRDGRLLVLANGAYGERIARIASVLGIDHEVIRFPENRTPDPNELDACLTKDSAITLVAYVHCETTSGILNPIETIGTVVRKHGRCSFVDAMSSFGAVPIDFEAAGIDYLVSSANKCIEGVPGFAFAIAKRERLLETESWARSLSLDLYAQWQGLESNGQFRFTPPTQVLLAFHQALVELEEEGGVDARAARYRANHQALVAGMRELGFVLYLEPELQSHVITTFRYPRDQRFDFEDFYRWLGERGLVIYPGKLTDADCFRIGTIGRIDPDDVRRLIQAVRNYLNEKAIRP